MLLQTAPLPIDKTHIFTTMQALLITAPTLLLGMYYFARSKRVSTFAMLTFIVGIAYGITVELIDIRTTETYFYTDLLLMVGRDPNWVPVSVGVSWACLMFVMMTTSDRLNLPVAWRPVMDGALAVCLDFVMDPVSSASVLVPRLGASCAFTPAQEFGGRGMWTWCVPEDLRALWFTVPISNFIGWFFVVACFSAAIRFVRGPLRAGEKPWPMQLAMLLAAAAVGGFALLCTAWAYPYLLRGTAVQYGVLSLLVLAPIIAVIVLRRQLRFDNPFDKWLLALPALILVSETGTFFWRGIDRPHWPGSALLLVASGVVSAILLLLPYAKRVAPESASGAAAQARRAA